MVTSFPQLHTEVHELKEENQRLKVTADQAVYLAEVVQVIIVFFFFFLLSPWFVPFKVRLQFSVIIMHRLKTVWFLDQTSDQADIVFSHWKLDQPIWRLLSLMDANEKKILH